MCSRPPLTRSDQREHYDGRRMRRLTVFSWGFWGWGTATPQLVAAVDAAERRRGFAPPLFVDIRFRRSGRAIGFKEHAFEQLLGRRRYRWMPTLGNSSIGTLKAARSRVQRLPITCSIPPWMQQTVTRASSSFAPASHRGPRTVIATSSLDCSGARRVAARCGSM